jgi:two-component system, OmpR family, response regulator
MDMNNIIMIVDDSPYIVDGLVALLKRRGYQPVPAHGGDECLSLLQTTRPDLILLDIMMEPMDGWETLEFIKKNPVTKDIPVLMFSAKKITPSEAEEHSMSIDDFVSKPVNPMQLLESIEQVFERRKDVAMEALLARDAGLDQTIIEEYSSLRKNIEVDRNLLSVLKTSRGMEIPGKEVSEADRADIAKLEEKIAAGEARLKEINDLFTTML